MLEVHFFETGSSHLKWDLDVWFVCSFVRLFVKSWLLGRVWILLCSFLSIHLLPNFLLLFGAKDIFSKNHWVLLWYCWWKKTCTTWDVQNPVNNGVNYLSTGFLPSTVWGGKIWDVKPLGVVILMKQLTLGGLVGKNNATQFAAGNWNTHPGQFPIQISFFKINNLHLVKFLSYRDWWDFDASQHFVGRLTRCHYPIWLRRGVLCWKPWKKRMKNGHCRCRIWMGMDVAQLSSSCEKLVAHLLIPKVDIQWHWLIWTHFHPFFSSVYIYISFLLNIYIYISCMHADSYLFNPLVKWTQVTWTFFLSGKAIARPGVSLEETNQVDLVLEKCGWGGGNNLKISTGVLKSQNDRLGFSPTKTPTWRM